MEQIPRRLKLYREKAGLSQSELASLIGVKTLDIINYEAGREMPSMEIFRRISHACDVSTDELLVFETETGIPGFFYGKTDE